MRQPTFQPPKRIWILHVLSAPSIHLFGWAFPLFGVMFGFAHRLHFVGNELWALWRPWAAKRWRYTTTFGYGRITHDRHLASERLARHEKVHKRQWQDDALRGLVIGALNYLVAANFGPEAGAIFTAVTMPLYIITNFASAWLRGGRPYRDSEHERSARAQTDEWGPKESSWEVHEHLRGPVPD